MSQPDVGAALRLEAAGWPGHQLSPGDLLTLELLLGGALAPRTGYDTDLPLAVSSAVEPGTTLALRDDEGACIAALDVTAATAAEGSWLLEGPVRAVEGIVHSDFRMWRRTPDDVRKLAAERGWERLLAYQPRHVVTQEDADAVARLAQSLDAALLLQPLHGAHLVGDLEWYALARSAVLVGDLLAEELGDDGFVLALTPQPPTPALAPRVAANFGATHLALDGADVAPADPAGLVVERLPFTATASLPPAVAAEMSRLRPTPDRVGFTVFFTGFSGSGKSTVAKALAARLLEIGPRRVTLLDGDVVRRLLSSELTFSREHRDLNIRRIGFVAGEATRHGGIAICAPIAPYDSTRREVRAMVERVGSFVLVHVATPLDVCESRDRKGLYARARAGELKEFTGISDPYEVPDDAELTIDTSAGTIDDAVDTVLAYLRTAGYLPT